MTQSADRAGPPVTEFSIPPIAAVRERGTQAGRQPSVHQREDARETVVGGGLVLLPVLHRDGLSSRGGSSSLRSASELVNEPVVPSRVALDVTGVPGLRREIVLLACRRAWCCPYDVALSVRVRDRSFPSDPCGKPSPRGSVPR
jgi:hypothetical protein